MTDFARASGGKDEADAALARETDSALSSNDHSTLDPLLVPTRESLLSRLQQTSEGESWREFFNTYWRLIYHNAIKAGLSDEDAQDVVQETMISLTKKIAEFRYNPARCSFKTWLMNLTRWKITDRLRERQKLAKDQDWFREQIERQIEKNWEDDWRVNLTEEALRRVQERAKPRMVQAFITHVIQGKSAVETGRLLLMSVPAVYLACYRVRKLVKNEALKIDEGNI